MGMRPARYLKHGDTMWAESTVWACNSRRLWLLDPAASMVRDLLMANAPTPYTDTTGSFRASTNAPG